MTALIALLAPALALAAQTSVPRVGTVAANARAVPGASSAPAPALSSPVPGFAPSLMSSILPTVAPAVVPAANAFLDGVRDGSPAGSIAEISAEASLVIERAGDLSKAPPETAQALGQALEATLAGGQAPVSAAATASDAAGAPGESETALVPAAPASPAAPGLSLPAPTVGKTGRWKTALKRLWARFFPRKQLKVALCQIDTTVGDFDYNVRHMLRFIRKAAEAGADLAVFPELVLSSYPPRDLLDYPHFLEANEKALEALLKGIKSIAGAPRVVIGSITRNPRADGRPLQNSALVIENGEIVHVQAKQLLPNYDVFDEQRYFEPAPAFERRLWRSPWGKVGCVICEDSWGASLHRGRRLYRGFPDEEIRMADLAVNISASPYEIGKHKRRKATIGDFARRVGRGVPLVYVNHVGPQDEVLFDGGSMVFSPLGEVLYEMPRFGEGLGLVEMRLGRRTRLLSSAEWRWDGIAQDWVDWERPPYPTEMETLYQALVTGIRGYFRKVGFRKAVIGLSGGIDSSVVAALAVEALGPENVVGVLMPSKYSSAGSVTDAAALAANLGLKHVISPIQEEVDAILKGIMPNFKELSAQFNMRKPEDDTTEDNIQARLRGIILMAVANKFYLLTLNTSNKSEMAVGQCTTYGDMAGALAPIADLFKTKVYELARFINSRRIVIPEAVLTKAPSAELAPGQTDEAKFGPFSTLDRVLEMYIEKQMSEDEIVAAGFDREYVRKTLQIVRKNEFKRNQSALVLKVTPKAFGSGRRIPVASYYRPVRDN